MPTEVYNYNMIPKTFILWTFLLPATYRTLLPVDNCDPNIDTTNQRSIKQFNSMLIMEIIHRCYSAMDAATATVLHLHIFPIYDQLP